MSISPEIIGVGGIFIDDIVLPTGETKMGQLGGGVLHALMGASIWDARPGLVGVIGEGFPEDHYDRITKQLDITGLTTLSIPQVRAWQLFEFDGSRREVYRVARFEPFVEGPTTDMLPDAYLDAQSIYLLQSFEGMRHWNQVVDGLTLWEPNQVVMLSENKHNFQQVLHDCKIDIVSPNLLEAQAIYGKDAPHSLVDCLLDEGVEIVALRMGEKGSIVATNTERHEIPALENLDVVDQTGAGNAYCGAFLLGIQRNRTLLEAGVMGTVSGSFCIEQNGVLNPDMVNPIERDVRFSTLMQTYKKL